MFEILCVDSDSAFTFNFSALNAVSWLTFILNTVFLQPSQAFFQRFNLSCIAFGILVYHNAPYQGLHI